MSLPRKKLNLPSPAADRRRARRVQVDLAGSYMLVNGGEHRCEVQDMSIDGVALVAPVAGRIGERVIAYLDEIGRIEGKIVRIHSIGFAMTITATPRKRDKLAAQLTWLANRHKLDLKQQRSHDRFMPRNPRATTVLPDGVCIPCRTVEMSASGAAVASETRPPINALIHLGKVEGRVVRVSGDGFAVQFTSPQDPELLEANLTNPA
jgi:hypothetical protein